MKGACHQQRNALRARQTDGFGNEFTNHDVENAQ